MNEIAHAVEGIALGIVVFAMLLYFVVFALATWAERPQIGRHDDGHPRAVRGPR